MKNLTLYILIVGVSIFIYLGVWNYFGERSQSTKDQPTSSIIPTEDSYKFDYQGKKLVVVWFEVDNRLILIPNFSDKLSLKNAKEKYGCEAISNSGFYGENGLPIGLFITEGKTYSVGVENSIFNGIILIDNFGNSFIDTLGNLAEKVEESFENIKFALQTGPLLMTDGEVLDLKLAKDKNARRVVMVKLNNNNLYLIVFYDPKSPLTGVYLDELPNVLAKLSHDLNFDVVDAINLDGGNASGIYTTNVELMELTNVGSFFCLVRN